MKICILIFFLFSFLFLYGKETPRFPVSAIPAELKKDAYAVVREDNMVFTIISKSRASLHVQHVITILTPKGKHFSTKTVWYDKLRKITAIKAQVFNANGLLIKKLKNTEITDHSAFDGLYSDNRMKVADLTQGQYPYTVEFEYEIEYNFLYYIDGSVINPFEDVSVQRAIYQLNFPENLKPRYKTHNIRQEPKYEKKDDVVSLTWTFANIEAQKFEVFSDTEKLILRIDAAPTIFEFEAFAGKMGSWDEFGQWISSLNAGRKVIPEDTKKIIREITSKKLAAEEKIKTVYEFLQNRTRYVNIELGIGGFQPFEASVVDKTGYGDCKALSNYMVSLLESIGIKSHYALIDAGDNNSDFETDFPSSQFNHVIVAVPNGADTIWLECTSQTNPFGYQGLFTGDRKALLITDNGASIVNTTRYPALLNIQSRYAQVRIESSGDARATLKTINSGLQYEKEDLNFILASPYDDQKKWLQQNINIPNFNIHSFSMENIKNKMPTAIVKAEPILNRFATVSGKRIFFTPNLMNRNSFVPEKNEDRKTNIVRKSAYTHFDTIQYQLPDGIYPEFLPENVTMKNQYGEYEASFKLDQGALIYIRKLKMNKGEFPPESYKELIDFYRNMSKADNTKLIFMSKT